MSFVRRPLRVGFCRVRRSQLGRLHETSPGLPPCPNLYWPLRRWPRGPLALNPFNNALLNRLALGRSWVDQFKVAGSLKRDQTRISRRLSEALADFKRHHIVQRAMKETLWN